MNIFDSLKRANNHFPDKDAIRFKAKVTTYHELYTNVLQLSSALSERLHIHRGDRVGLFLSNIPDFIAAYFALMRLGAIAVSLNVMLKRNEVQFILRDSEAKALITTSYLLDQIPESSRVPGLEAVVSVDEPDRAGVQSFGKLLAADSKPAAQASLDPGDGAAILYTSGTTGVPKGVLLSQANLVSNVYATNHHTNMTAKDRLLCYLPLFHCFGQNFIMNASVNAGATLILHERFVWEEILDSVKRDSASMFFGVPTVYLRLLGLPQIESYLESVRYFFSAAAPMPVEVAVKWRQKFGRNIFEGYGLTETSPFASYNHDFSYREGSVGSPIENVEMKIADEKGNDLPPGELGEIAIKGPNVMKGYYGQPQETARVVRDGWFFTGDIGRRDEKGYFYLVDRIKDMINVSGFKVWPREIEDILLEHPLISEAAVVGVSDPDSGEAVKAFVVLKKNIRAKEGELIEYCRSRMAVYKAPRYVEFRNELPKTPAGKILKRELRRTEAQNPTERRSA